MRPPTLPINFCQNPVLNYYRQLTGCFLFQFKIKNFGPFSTEGIFRSSPSCSSLVSCAPIPCKRVDMATLSTLGGFTAGAFAACRAVTVTNPMEVVKTRLHLQGELAAKGQEKKTYTGVFQALRIIAVNEGLKGKVQHIFLLFLLFLLLLCATLLIDRHSTRVGSSGLIYFLWNFVDMCVILVLLSNLFEWMSIGILRAYTVKFSENHAWQPR